MTKRRDVDALGRVEERGQRAALDDGAADGRGRRQQAETRTDGDRDTPARAPPPVLNADGCEDEGADGKTAADGSENEDLMVAVSHRRNPRTPEPPSTSGG